DYFVGLTAIALPFLAVFISTHVKPVVPMGRVITLVALIEYGVAALFGVVTMFLGFIDDIGTDSPTSGVGAALLLLDRLSFLALLGLGGFLVLRVYLGLYSAPKPVAQPGLYGHPQAYGQPGVYGQPGPA